MGMRWSFVFLALVASILVGCSSEDPGKQNVLGANGIGTQAQLAGACCFEDGSCVVLTSEECGLQGGIYQGDETLCDPNPCELPPPPPAEGACCFADGSCVILTAEACGLQGGIYQGDEIACDPNPCELPPPPPAEGACCFADGSCVILTAEDCGLQGGIYQGDETLCDPNPCELPPPPPAEGACCFADGSCVILTAEACGLQGGIYQGDETLCDPNPCEQPEKPEGCGHGYWKNHEEAWEPTGYTPEDLVGAVFPIPADLAELADDTLMDALEYPGGNGVIGAARILLRHAVAGLLNAAHPDVNFPRTPAEIIAAVGTALASGDRQTILDCKDEVNQQNSQGCPLH